MSDCLVVVIESMGGGGAQQVVASLLRHWCLAGREIHLVTFQGSDTDAFDVPLQVKRHFVNGTMLSHNLMSGIVSNIRRIKALRAAIRESGAPVVLSFITSTNILAIVASYGLGRRVIISERNDPRRQSLPAIWKILRHLVYPFADVVTANSHMALRALSNKVSSNRQVWLPNPLRQTSSVSVAEKQGALLLAVGRLHPQKDYETLLKAFAMAQPRMAGWTLRILGSGQLESELRAMAIRLGISRQVEFLGHIHDPFPHYRAADMYVMSSRYEGSPNALWEAMSCGLASVVSDAIEGALEVLHDGKGARVVPVGDPLALASALVELGENPDLRRRIGQEASLVVRQFAPPGVFDAWDRLLFISK